MKYYTSICLLAKEENDYINEWLDWHLNKLKFDHVYIFDNESKFPIEDSVDIAFHDRVTFLTWRRKDYTFIMQNECYKYFIDTYKEENTWVAFIDADEFIRIVDDDIDINSFLLDYENYNGLFIEWIMYNANGEFFKKDGLVRDRFKTSIDYENKPFTGKCIIKINEFKKMGPHLPYPTNKNYNVVMSNKQIYNPYDKKQYAPKDKIVVDHYFTKSYEEWCEKLGRGSCNTLKRKLEEFFIFNPNMKPKEDK